MKDTEKQALLDELLGSLNSPSGRLRLVQAESPLGLSCQCNFPAGSPTTIQVFPPHGRFLVQGVRSLNGPHEVTVREVLAGSSVPRNAAAFDSATYALGHAPREAELAEHAAYFRAPWGWISEQSPLLLTFEAWGCPSVAPFLDWTLYGVLEVEHDFEQPELTVAMWKERADAVIGDRPTRPKGPPVPSAPTRPSGWPPREGR